MGKLALPIAGAAGLALLTGGASLPASLATEGGAGAAAGAAGLGEGALAAGTTDALAAQGAAGLLGSAGAEAAGYGSLLGAGGLPEVAAVADQATPAMTAEVNGQPMTAFGDSGQYWGQSITDGTGMTPNAYTGGYDSLGGMDRVGQRVGSLFDGNNNTNLSKIFKFNQNGQQPQQARPAVGGGARPMQSQPSEPMRSPYDTPMTEEEMYRKMYGGY